MEDLALAHQRNKEHLEVIEQKNREIAERSSLALRELATPIISVWQGTLTLPIIGAVDTERSADMMETLLDRVVSEQATHVIMDITGVSVLDSRRADQFLRMANAVRLLGATCFLTGISTEIAQTMAQLGIDVHQVRTLRRMSDAGRRGPPRARLRALEGEARAASAHVTSGRFPKARVCHAPAVRF